MMGFDTLVPRSANIHLSDRASSLDCIAQVSLEQIVWLQFQIILPFLVHDRGFRRAQRPAV
jgi:hypothetical protein